MLAELVVSSMDAIDKLRDEQRAAQMREAERKKSDASVVETQDDDDDGMNNTGTVDYGTMIAGTMVRHDDDMGGNTGTMVANNSGTMISNNSGTMVVGTLYLFLSQIIRHSNITLEHNRYDDKAYFR